MSSTAAARTSHVTTRPACAESNSKGLIQQKHNLPPQQLSYYEGQRNSTSRKTIEKHKRKFRYHPLPTNYNICTRPTGSTSRARRSEYTISTPIYPGRQFKRFSSEELEAEVTSPALELISRISWIPALLLSTFRSPCYPQLFPGGN